MTKMPYEKLIRDGMVAVIISPGFGAGWSTWAGDELREFCLFDRRLVECIETGGDLSEVALGLVGDQYLYTGGAGDAEIVWLPEGKRFRIDEYDGSESLVAAEDLVMTA